MGITNLLMSSLRFVSFPKTCEERIELHPPSKVRMPNIGRFRAYSIHMGKRIISGTRAHEIYIRPGLIHVLLCRWKGSRAQKLLSFSEGKIVGLCVSVWVCAWVTECKNIRANIAPMANRLTGKVFPFICGQHSCWIAVNTFMRP